MYERVKGTRVSWERAKQILTDIELPKTQVKQSGSDLVNISLDTSRTTGTRQWTWLAVRASAHAVFYMYLVRGEIQCSIGWLSGVNHKLRSPLPLI